MPTSSLEEILAESEAEQRRSPRWSRVHLLLPFVLILGACLVLYLSGDLKRFGLAATAMAVSLGKVIIVFGGLPAKTYAKLGLPKMSVAELATMVFLLDLWVAYFLTFNLHHVYRVRLFRIGQRLHDLHTYCRFFLETRPWMRRWAFTGVLMFVLFPLTGTGAIGGSILGRLGGLRARTTLGAIALGSALGCTLMAAFATPLEPVFERIQDEWWFQALGIAAVVIVVGLLVWAGRRMSRAAQQHARTRPTGETR